MSAPHSQNQTGIDWCAKCHAEAAAEHIRDYWRRRGQAVDVWLEEMPGSGGETHGRTVYAIRSDLKLRAVR